MSEENNQQIDVKSIVKAHSAFRKFQSEVSAIKKTDEAMHGSKFAPLDKVYEAIRKPAIDNGITYIQSAETLTTGVTGIRTTIYHDSGVCISSSFLKIPVIDRGNANHELAGSITYFRRYTLLTALGLQPEDDDTDGASDARPTGSKPQTRTYAENGKQLDVWPRDKVVTMKLKGLQNKCIADVPTGDLISHVKYWSDKNPNGMLKSILSGMQEEIMAREQSKDNQDTGFSPPSGFDVVPHPALDDEVPF